MSTLSLDRILDYVTANVYDPHHGMLPMPDYAISATGLLDFLAKESGLSKGEMGKLFDEARVRVHGERTRR